MKNAKKVFNKFFWVWFVATILLVGLMLIIGPPHAKWFAATILALFMLLPVSNWMYRILAFATNYVSYLNNNFKDEIKPFATTNTMIKPKELQDNPGFYLFLKVATGVFCLILALLCLVFKGTSFNIVYAWLHTIEFIFRGKIGFLELLLYLLLTIAFIYLVYWIADQILNAKYYDVVSLENQGQTSQESDNNVIYLFNRKKAFKVFAIAIVGFYGKIIFSGLLLKFTTGMIWSNLVFWTVIVGSPIVLFNFRKLIYFVSSKIRELNPINPIEEISKISQLIKIIVSIILNWIR